jgi:hypothetical protein
MPFDVPSFPLAIRSTLRSRAVVEIMDGERWDINSDSTKVHRGTRAYLKMIGATPKDGTARDVPSSDVTPEEKYSPPR